MAEANAATRQTSDGPLAVEALVVHRGSRRVVDGVTFSARPGAITALIGPNGAGKSTLLKAVAGLLPFAGAVSVGGADVRALAPRARARLIGYVPQHSALEAPLAVRDVVAQGRFAHHETAAHGAYGMRRADDAAVARAMAMTDLEPLGDRAFTRLSYGERRRVLLARALATEARVLLLDEPTAALDVGHALSLLAVLRRLSACGVMVLVVLHQLQEAMELADHVVLLVEGRVRDSGPPARVIDARAMRDVYGVEMALRGGLAFQLAAGAGAPPGAGGDTP